MPICPNCSVDLKADRDLDTKTMTWNRVWNCTNCSWVQARREYHRSAGMTPSQEKAIEAIKVALQDRYPSIKECQVDLLESGNVSLRIVVGYDNDEGTMQEIFCRVRAHVFIGRKGAMSAYLGSKKVPVTLHDIKYMDVREREQEKKQ